VRDVDDQHVDFGRDQRLGAFHVVADRADGRADEAFFGNRRVHDPVGAEFFEQPSGDLVRALEGADLEDGPRAALRDERREHQELDERHPATVHRDDLARL